MHNPQAASRDGVAQAASDILARLRAHGPRVHCITNAVAQNFTANVLLAAGCVPSMTLSPEEIGPFVAGAQGLLVNLGTFDSERREATEIAVASCGATQTAMGARSRVRRSRPAARCFRARTDRPPPNGRPAQSCRIFRTLRATRHRAMRLRAYAHANKIVVGLSGETDLVTDGSALWRLRQRTSADGQGDGHGLRRLCACCRVSRGRDRCLSRDVSPRC